MVLQLVPRGRRVGTHFLNRERFKVSEKAITRALARTSQYKCVYLC
jgi:hypothetical protein